jgi:pimeloyl-ACP methyl ester carboxylesterase
MNEVKMVLLVSSLLAMVQWSGSLEAQERNPGELKIEPYVFQSQSGEKVDAELGRLTVLENRKNAKSNVIELAFVRFKSTAERPGPPIVYLAGGPGGSGIAAARGSRFPLFMAMREVGDVIALDQRGVGMSKPNLQCRERVSYPPDKPASRDEVLEEFRKQSRACAEYWRSQGVDLTGYNTNESADDLEDVRRALGAEKMSLWAISYGTHLALATLKRHEKSIHRVILAGVEGPDHTVKLPSNIQTHLAHIDRLVKADPTLSKEIPDFLGLMKSVLDRVEREPVTVEVTPPGTQQTVKVTINKLVLQNLILSNFTGGEGSLPARVYAVSKGEFVQAAQGWLRYLRSGSGLGSAMSYMMDCSSGGSAERRRRIEREAKETLLGDLIDFPIPQVCDAWGSPDLGAAFRAPVKTSVPALFISGTFDVRTPVSNAEEVRKGFSNSTHLIIDGAVHSDPLFLSSPKIKEAMLEFMKGQPVSTTGITLPPVRFSPITPPRSN